MCRAVVRFCSSLLTKVVDSLAPSVTAILVSGKQVSRAHLPVQQQTVFLAVSAVSVAVWLNGSTLVMIIEFTVCWAWLVLGWVTV